MYWQTTVDSLPSRLDDLGLATDLRSYKQALIKINMARPPEANHPRTDPELLKHLLVYASQNGARCTICEAADGHLVDNLRASGLYPDIMTHCAEVVDLDLEPARPVQSRGQSHYLPEVFYRHPVRIAMPCASKRRGMVFSNNVKLFIGAVPRRCYQDELMDGWRARIHSDLHSSIVAVFTAVMVNTPFTYFVNGGNANLETLGDFCLPVFAGNDPIELDVHVARDVFEIEVPEYLSRLYSEHNESSSLRITNR